jgi:exopolysaccharide production protein ExoQ
MQEMNLPMQPTAAAPVEKAFSAGELLVDLWWIIFLTIASNAGINYASQIQQFAWIIADVITLCAFLVTPKVFLGYTRDIPTLMTWPALATLSTAWSLTPGLTLYHGLQFFATYLAGFYFINRYGLIRIAKMLFISLALAGFLSLLVILMHHPYSLDTVGAWSGLYSTKNELGSYMSLELILGLLLLWARWQRLLVSATMIVAAILLINSRSANSMIVLMVILLTVFPFAFFVGRGTQISGMFMGAAIAIGCVIGALLMTLEINPYQLMLEAFDKDATLTGRTTLWTYGLDSFWQNPIFGIGYKAYWESTATTSRYLVSILQQELRSFHNNLLDVAVALGVVGVTVFISGLISIFLSTFQALLRGPSPYCLWPFLLAVYVTLVGLTDYPLFYNHALYQLLIVAIAVGVSRNYWNPKTDETQTETEVRIRVAPTNSSA